MRQLRPPLLSPPLLLLAAMAAAPVTEDAEAADVSRLQLEQASGDGASVALYLDARGNSAEPIPAADLPALSVFIDGRAVSMERTVDFADSGEGIGYIFLVDVSKSLSRTTYALIRTALNDWIDAMRPADRAALISFGSQVRRLSGFTGDRVALHALVAELGPTDQDTRLYQALDDALALADSHRNDPGLPRRKLIVTLSDGDDDLPDGEVGITLEEVRERIEQSGVPIQAIAFRARRDGLAVLDELARRSGGTRLRADSADGIADSYADLRLRIDQAILAEGRCPDCPNDGDRYPLQIRLASGLGVPGQPRIRMAAASPAAPSSAGEARVEDAPDTAALAPPLDGPISAPDTSARWIADWRLWAGIGLIIAVTAGLIAWRVGGRRPEPPKPLTGIDLGTVPMPPDTAAPKPSGPTDPHPSATQGPPPEDIPTAGGGQRLTLTVINGAAPRGQVYVLEVGRPAVIGRGEGCTLSIPGDDEISRHHARIALRDARPVILDLDSTHGTFVNGVPVRHERLLEPGDILRLGRTELKLGD